MLVRDTPLGGMGDVGLGTDGLPVAFVRTVPPSGNIFHSAVGFLHCSDRSCHRGTVHVAKELPISGASLVPGRMKLAIGGDGLPVAVLSYFTDPYDGGTAEDTIHLSVTKCLDIECASTTTREIFNVVPISVNGFAFDTPGIDVGSDGLPIISFGYTLFDEVGGNTGRLFTFSCTDAQCLHLTRTEHTELGTQAGRSSAVVVPQDGRPVVAYSTIDSESDLRGSLYLGRCVDTECSSMTSTLLQDAAERSSQNSQWPSSAPGRDLELALSSDGLPVLAYIEDYRINDPFASRNPAWLVRCLDADCAGHDRQRLDDPSGYEVGGIPAMGYVDDIDLSTAVTGETVVAYRAYVANYTYKDRDAVYLWSCGTGCSTASQMRLDQGFVTGFDLSLTFSGGRMVMAMNGWSSADQVEAIPVVYSCESFACTGDPSAWIFQPGTGSGSGGGSGVQFSDTAGSVFESDITWLAEQGITKGCNPPANTLFCPNEPVTRGQMAAFLNRALILLPGPDLFVDTAGSVFSADIGALATTGITKGCNPPADTRFCPDEPVTRGQMAAFLVRALGYTDDGGGNLFTDDNTSVFKGDIDRLATAGVTKGCNPPLNDRYCPNDSVTRGQMAAFLHRALGS